MKYNKRNKLSNQRSTKIFMVSVILFLVMTTIFYTFKASAQPAPGILGRWRAEYPIRDQGVNFYLRFNFQSYSTQLDVLCQFFDGAQLQTSAIARTHYFNNDIYIDENRQSVVNDGYHFCRSTLQIDRWSAYFDGMGRMILFVSTPYQQRVSLIRDEMMPPPPPPPQPPVPLPPPHRP